MLSKVRVWPVGHFRHPANVFEVVDRDGKCWRRGTTRWTSDGKAWVRWYKLTTDLGPLTEVIQPKQTKESTDGQ